MAAVRQAARTMGPGNECRDDNGACVGAWVDVCGDSQIQLVEVTGQ